MRKNGKNLSSWYSAKMRSIIKRLDILEKAIFFVFLKIGILIKNNRTKNGAKRHPKNYEKVPDWIKTTPKNIMMAKSSFIDWLQKATFKLQKEDFYHQKQVLIKTQKNLSKNIHRRKNEPGMEKRRIDVRKI